MHAMTCAHRTLPLNTMIKVTNLNNGATATCRVNDRGPFVHGRVLDASAKVADVLGFRGAGLARVKIEVQ